jgi:peptide methionine sulfoxide reductase msrA/msrB
MIKQLSVLTALLTLVLFTACAQKGQKATTNYTTELPSVITDPAKYNKLTPDEARVILHEGTERAFTGEYFNLKKEGVYICRQCNNPLFRSEDKFDSGTGWPSFDDFIPGSVKEVSDADGYRVEIECANCGGHLGHVFKGEGFTQKQTRHCANSISLKFVAAKEAAPKKAKPANTEVQRISDYIAGQGYEKYAVATFAGGCFWCTEAAFERIEGVVDVISGYSGGQEEYPTYEQVGAGRTNHAEAIQVYFDPAVVSFEKLLEVFFVAHDPTQLNRQGPDVGRQYRSAIFYHDETQQKAAEAAMKKLGDSGKFSDPIVTELKPYKEFWTAEGYHQDYYPNHPENPYVQRVSRPKVEKVEKVFKDILKAEYKQ